MGGSLIGARLISCQGGWIDGMETYYRGGIARLYWRRGDRV